MMRQSRFRASSSVDKGSYKQLFQMLEQLANGAANGSGSPDTNVEQILSYDRIF